MRLQKGFYRRMLSLLLCVALVLVCGCQVSPQGAAKPDDTLLASSEIEPESEIMPSSEPETSSSDVSSAASSETAVSSDAVTSKDQTASTVASEATSSAPSETATSSGQSDPWKEEMKAIWISQYDLLDIFCLDGVQRPKESFRELFAGIAKQIKSSGFNTVFLQSKPYSDSFYLSEYFPWSKFVSGGYGVTVDYDPYAIMVELLRAQGLSVHGWINPLRGMLEKEIDDVPERYPIKKWFRDPEKRAKNLVLNEGRWYYNAGSEEVRKLVADGAKELLMRYDLDGIHIDDYFYYSESIADISAMVKALYEAVKSVDQQALFGVSPEGNIERDYEVHFADVKTWCSEPGYLDYICPQLYYGMEHETQPFAETAAKWNSMISKDSGVKLLFGITLSKAGQEDPYAGTGKLEWTKSNDIAARSLREARKLSNYSGVSLFCYQYIFVPGTDQRMERCQQEGDAFLAELARGAE